MRVKGIQTEDFINYKMPSMFISTCCCDWKCCLEQNLDTGVCQNAPLSKSPTKEISNELIYENFQSNPITKAIVIGGLEPMLQIDEIVELVSYFRQRNDNSMFVIYTGYYPEEIQNELALLKQYNNIVVKFGRFKLNKQSIDDSVLGVTLVSDNQWAEQIS